MALSKSTKFNGNGAILRRPATLLWGLQILLALSVFGVSSAPATSSAAEIEAPLIAAEKSPTRVRPHAQPDANAAASPAKPGLLLPIQGIPEAPAISAPVRGRVVAELTDVRGVRTSAEAAGAFRLQLASLRTAAAAGREVQRLRHRFSSQVADLDLSVERVAGPRGVYYRVVSEPLVEKETASHHCAALVSDRSGCLVLAVKGTASSRHHQRIQVAHNATPHAKPHVTHSRATPKLPTAAAAEV